MNWPRTLLLLDDVLGILLITRLLRMRLSRVYLLFAAFIFFQLLGSTIFMLANKFLPLDYRSIWILFQVPIWSVTFLLIYALLDAVLATLPGILWFSRRLLNGIFVGTIAVSVLSANMEFRAIPRTANDWLESAVQFGLVFDQVFSTSVCLALLLTITFVLWFPVQMPRNLVVFSAGFAVYFAFRVVLLITHYLGLFGRNVNPSVLDTLGLSVMFFSSLTLIDVEGQLARVRIGHSWQKEEQLRLVSRLEDMNTALLRSARRS